MTDATPPAPPASSEAPDVTDATKATAATGAASHTSEAAPSRPELPDRLSVDPRSKHHVAAVFEHNIGIRFKDRERFDVEEYCISEGWIKVPSGKTKDRRGQPLLITLKGRVEAFYK
jgi:hypothetical protein